MNGTEYPRPIVLRTHLSKDICSHGLRKWDNLSSHLEGMCRSLLVAMLSSKNKSKELCPYRKLRAWCVSGNVR